MKKEIQFAHSAVHFFSLYSVISNSDFDSCVLVLIVRERETERMTGVILYHEPCSLFPNSPPRTWEG